MTVPTPRCGQPKYQRFHSPVYQSTHFLKEEADVNSSSLLDPEHPGRRGDARVSLWGARHAGSRKAEATRPATAAPAAAKAEATKAPAATAAPAAAKAPAGGVAVAPAGEFPIVKDKITMKVFMCPNTAVSDYVNNEFTKWLEAQTNIKLELDLPPVADAQNKLNLMLASDDLPEVIIGCNIRLDQMQILAEQGVALPLNDYIDKYGVETKKMFETNPAIKPLITLLDGKIYGLPHYNDCYHCSMSQKMWVYKPWLDKLGLKVPETTDEFEAMLKAFKEKDPNGNGKADEIPLSGSKLVNGGWHSPIDQFLMNSFVYNDNVTGNGARHLILDNGTVKAAFTEAGLERGPEVPRWPLQTRPDRSAGVHQRQRPDPTTGREQRAHPGRDRRRLVRRLHPERRPQRALEGIRAHPAAEGPQRHAPDPADDLPTDRRPG